MASKKDTPTTIKELGDGPSDIDEVWNDLVQDSHGREELSEVEIDALFSPELDTREGAVQSEWERRFEVQVNTFFDEAIARVPGFVERHLTSFRRVLGRSISPKTGVGDVLIGMRNMLAGAVRAAGGKDLSTTTFTHDHLTEAFEREVVGSSELESLLSRLFSEFEDEQWERLAKAYLADEDSREDHDAIVAKVRAHLLSRMEGERAHDPLLAQALRSGVKIGLPATLSYMLFGKMTYRSSLGSETASKLYERQLKFYNRILNKLGGFEIPSWLGAMGWAGGVVGSLAVGGVMEYALNSMRDIKGEYIRQLNSSRNILLYGDNPDDPAGQGLLHVVRGLERQFDRVQSIEGILPDDES